MADAISRLEQALVARLAPEEIVQRRVLVREAVLRDSAFIRSPQFDRFAPDDVQAVFDLYDRHFYDGRLRMAAGSRQVRFHISRRATRRGGALKTLGNGEATSFELSVSATLLFGSFREGQRDVRMSGQLCPDRLDGLQRIVEHESVHLAEMLVWGDSSCTRGRFQGIASRLFGHTEHSHALLTPRERAAREHGLHVGDRVSFAFEGRQLSGVVSRITKRATVLVPDPAGRTYSDGKRYAVYYIPIPHLTPLNKAE